MNIWSQLYFFKIRSLCSHFCNHLDFLETLLIKENILIMNKRKKILNILISNYLNIQKFCITICRPLISKCADIIMIAFWTCIYINSYQHAIKIDNVHIYTYIKSFEIMLIVCKLLYFISYLFIYFVILINILPPWKCRTLIWDVFKYQ